MTRGNVICSRGRRDSLGACRGGEDREGRCGKTSSLNARIFWRYADEYQVRHKDSKTARGLLAIQRDDAQTMSFLAAASASYFDSKSRAYLNAHAGWGASLRPERKRARAV